MAHQLLCQGASILTAIYLYPHHLVSISFPLILLKSKGTPPVKSISIVMAIVDLWEVIQPKSASPAAGGDTNSLHPFHNKLPMLPSPESTSFYALFLLPAFASLGHSNPCQFRGCGLFCWHNFVLSRFLLSRIPYLNSTHLIPLLLPDNSHLHHLPK